MPSRRIDLSPRLCARQAHERSARSSAHRRYLSRTGEPWARAISQDPADVTLIGSVRNVMQNSKSSASSMRPIRAPGRLRPSWPAFLRRCAARIRRCAGEERDRIIQSISSQRTRSRRRLAEATTLLSGLTRGAASSSLEGKFEAQTYRIRPLEPERAARRPRRRRRYRREPGAAIPRDLAALALRSEQLSQCPHSRQHARRVRANIIPRAKSEAGFDVLTGASSTPALRVGPGFAATAAAHRAWPGQSARRPDACRISNAFGCSSPTSKPRRT